MLQTQRNLLQAFAMDEEELHEEKWLLLIISTPLSTFTTTIHCILNGLLPYQASISLHVHVVCFVYSLMTLIDQVQHILPQPWWDYQFLS